MTDHPDVQGLVLEARDHLKSGDNKEAARLLTDAAYHTHDPKVEQEVRELAAEGLQKRAGSARAARRKSSESPICELTRRKAGRIPA